MNVVIITAGGKGSRLSHKFKKQFFKIDNKPLLFWTVDKFVGLNGIEKIIITLPKTETKKYKELIMSEFHGIDIDVISGGNKRQDSVFEGLKFCPIDTKYVLIHDGVRPFVETWEINKLLTEVVNKKAVVPVFKSQNTIKEISGKQVVKTYDRSKIVNVATPQAFDYQILLKYHKKACYEGKYFTDEAAILEYYGYKVYFIEGSSKNFKVTNKHDLKIAKTILENSRSN